MRNRALFRNRVFGASHLISSGGGPPPLPPFSGDWYISAADAGDGEIEGTLDADPGHPFWQIEAWDSVNGSRLVSSPTPIAFSASVLGVPGAGSGMATARARSCDGLGVPITDWSDIQQTDWQNVFRLTQAGDFRVTEAGDFRITES